MKYFIILMFVLVSFPCHAETHWKWDAAVKSNYTMNIPDDVNPVTFVNEEVNKVKFISDMENYGISDKWVTPEEFFKNGGDCEDYAIAKYVALRSHGLSIDNMHLAVVYSDKLENYHAILIVKYMGKTYYMDNMSDKVSKLRPDYKMIYKINDNGIIGYGS
jgi:predicted transglutaminase-like cysteine proteinase